MAIACASKVAQVQSLPLKAITPISWAAAGRVHGTKQHPSAVSGQVDLPAEV